MADGGGGGGNKQSFRIEFDINLMSWWRARFLLLHFSLVSIFNSRFTCCWKFIIRREAMIESLILYVALKSTLYAVPTAILFCFPILWCEYRNSILLSLPLCVPLFRSLCQTYVDSQLNYSYTSNFMGRRVQNNRIWPFLLLLLAFISFLIAWLWFHYSFRRLAHYFSFIQLSCDWVCAIRSPCPCPCSFLNNALMLK